MIAMAQLFNFKLDDHVGGITFVRVGWEGPSAYRPFLFSFA